jgi:hypothetical protein
VIRFYNPFSQFFSCPRDYVAKWVVKLVVQKFHGLVLGWVDLIDVMMWLNLYGREAVRRKLKKINTKNAFFAFFWAYVRQSLNQVGWVTSVRPNFGIGIRYRQKVSVSVPKFFLPKPKLFFSFFFQNLKKKSCFSAS